MFKIWPMTKTRTEPTNLPVSQNDSFRKAVEAIHIAPKKGAISLNQQRTWDALIKNAVQQSSVQAGRDEFSVPLQDLMREMGLDRSNNRDYVKEIARSLIGMVVDWNYVDGKNDNVYIASGLLADAKIDSTYLHYSFSKQMTALLMKPNVYATIDMRVLRSFKRGHSSTLWQNVIRYKSVGQTKRFEVDTLRELFVGQDSDKSSYREYKIFKRAVLTPAVKEVNEVTDHIVELKEIKEGRFVKYVQFTITQKPEAIGKDLDPELIEALVRVGITNRKARSLVDEYGPERIRGALVLVQARVAKKDLVPVTSVTAYLEKAAAEGWASPASVVPQVAEEPRPVEVRQTAEDIRLQILFQRIPQAEAYFSAESTESQRAMVEEYNEQQTMRKWRVSTSKAPTKMAQQTFYLWLARKAFGDPSEEDVVSFAVAEQRRAAES